MHKALKVRIYPNTKQITLIAKTLGCVRFVYNYMLALRKKTYEETGHGISCDACIKMLPDLKKTFPFLKEPDSIALQQSVRHLDDAFTRFFNKQNDYPQFKKKRYDRSYTTMRVKNNIQIDGNAVVLPKLGRVKAKIHRNVPDDWTLKSATVERTPSDKYFVSLSFEYENQVPETEPRHIIGLDYSSPLLYVDSNGDEPDYEKPFRKYQAKLAKEQRKLARMREANIAGYDSKNRPIWKKPLSECKNYQKQKRKVAKVYEKIANCRRDALNKLSLYLAESYDAVAVEDLNLKAISQSLNLGKNTMDNGYGMFLNMLKYKLEDRGKQLVKVDKFFASTKTCSCCGNKKLMLLSERSYECPECGNKIDRDLNAAINIKEEAKRLLQSG